MPVTGAIPIVIPTLMKSWIRSAKTIEPATTAEKRSRATATILTPRQMISAYSTSRIVAPRKPRCSASDEKMKSVECSGR